MQSKSIVRRVELAKLPVLVSRRGHIDWKVVRKTKKRRKQKKRKGGSRGRGRTSHSVTIATAASNPILMTPRPP